MSKVSGVSSQDLVKYSKKNPPPVKLTDDELKLLESMVLGVFEHQNQVMMSPDGRPYGDKDDKDLDGDKNTSEHQTVSETVGYKLIMADLIAARARKTGNSALEEKIRPLFAKVWQWTNSNMVRKNVPQVYDTEKWLRTYLIQKGIKKPGEIKTNWVPMPGTKKNSLPAWRWLDDVAEGRGGIIHSVSSAPRKSDGVWVDGLDSAPDADLFIIAALRIAAILWPEDSEKYGYYSSAQEMTKDAREKYAVKIGGEWHLVGGDEYYKCNGMNPSYFFEAVCDICSELDPAGREIWQELKFTGMKDTINAANATLHKGDGTKVVGSVHVPQNWFTYDGFQYADMPWFDAIDWMQGWEGRTPWMKGAYYLYNRNSVAKRFLSDSTGTAKDFGPHAFYVKEFTDNKFIQMGFGMDGTKNDPTMVSQNLDKESPFGNGIYLGYFYAGGDENMTRAMIGKLKDAYQPEIGTFKIFGRVENENYFSDWWGAAGAAMADGMVEDFFGVYKVWRVKNGLPEVEKEDFTADDITAAGFSVENIKGKALDLSSNSYWVFDGCKRMPEGLINCNGNAVSWYLGGSGTNLPAISPYTGIFISADGKAGKIKVELSGGKDQKKYTNETAAVSAENKYIPFENFNEEIGYQPKGPAFNKETGASKLQVIAIGTSENGPINFTLKNITLVEEFVSSRKKPSAANAKEEVKAAPSESGLTKWWHNLTKHAGSKQSEREEIVLTPTPIPQVEEPKPAPQAEKQIEEIPQLQPQAETKPAAKAEELAPVKKADAVTGNPLSGLVGNCFSGSGRKLSDSEVTFSGRTWDDGMILFEGTTPLKGHFLFKYSGSGPFKIVFIDKNGNNIKNSKNLDHTLINVADDKEQKIANILIPQDKETKEWPVKVNVMANNQKVDVKLSDFAIAK